MATVSESTRPFSWRSAAATSPGNVRSHNEDAVLELPAAGLWAVADGMGGHEAGDVASRMIVEELRSVATPSGLSELRDEVESRLCAVNAELYRGSLRQGRTSGSTVAVLLAHDRHCLSLWAGDSRVYRLRDGELTCITHDHSAVQALVDQGVLDEKSAAVHGAANVITRAVGGASELCLDGELRLLEDGDGYLLCSDGLYKELSDAAMASHVAGKRPEEACEALVAQALRGACNDNVSVVVVEFAGAHRRL
jgi:type VI secretion system protein ImpM